MRAQKLIFKLNAFCTALTYHTYLVGSEPAIAEMLFVSALMINALMFDSVVRFSVKVFLIDLNSILIKAPVQL